jgi:hypothetical protein
MTAVRTAVQCGVALVGAAALAWASRVPMPAYGPDQALLRVAWSARPERIEHCRQPTRDELANVPRHMQQRSICEGKAATYRLEVRTNGALHSGRDVRGGGLRGDRRLYDFHEFAVHAGESLVEVRFTRDGPATAPEANTPADVVPGSLSLRQPIAFGPARAVLVTYAPERRALVVIRESR